MANRGKAGLVILGGGIAVTMGTNKLLHHFNILRPTEAKMASLFAIREGLERAKNVNAEDEEAEECVKPPGETNFPAKVPTTEPYKEAQEYIMTEFKDLYRLRGTLTAFKGKVVTFIRNLM